MDQHMDDSVNLDGSIGVEFDHHVDAQSALETCLVNTECGNNLGDITSVELGNIEGQIVMETESGDYLHPMSSHNMPILGGEEEIMSDPHQKHENSISNSEKLESMDMTTQEIHEQIQKPILFQITKGSPEHMLSQESSESMPSNGSQERLLSQGSQNTMLLQASPEPIISRESKETVLSQASQESILLTTSLESNLSQGSQDPLLLAGSPVSNLSQIPQLPQDLQDSIMAQVSQMSVPGQSLLMSSDGIVPQLVAPSQLQLQLMKAQAPRTTSGIKQIAIAPKPNPSIKLTGAKFANMSGKQFTLAPKPMQLVARKPGSSIVKKIALGNAQAAPRATTVLGSYGPGKQLVLVPSSSGGPQRLKLVQGGSVQYITNEGKQILQPQALTAKKLIPTIGTGNKQVITKVLLQGGDSGSSSASGQSLLAKVGGGGTRFISLQQAQQLGIITCSTSSTGTKLVSMSPSRQVSAYGGRIGRPKQPTLSAVKSPSKIAPALLPQGASLTKVLSSAQLTAVTTNNQGTPQIVKLEHSNQSGENTNSLLVSSSASTSAVSNIGSRQHFQNIFNSFATKSVIKVEPCQAPEEHLAVLTSAGVTKNQAGNPSQTQIHQIDVPGKGVQYVRLVAAAASQSQTLTSKPRLDSSSNNSNVVPHTRTVYNLPLLPDGQVTWKPQQKLVRIAPGPVQVSQANTDTTTTTATTTTTGSLTPAPAPTPAHHTSSQKDTYRNRASIEILETREEARTDAGNPLTEELNDSSSQEIYDSKASLRSLIAEAVGDNGTQQYSDQSTLVHNSQSDIEEDEEEQMEQDEARERDRSRETEMEEDVETEEGEGGRATQHVFMLPAYMQRDKELSTLVEVKPDIVSQFQNAKDEAELGAIRPRKPCNCTKSQCLKLYCDCFANGEFCNRCNCNNCFNNLDNEEERQKAIRSCLDRNPYAFRPKIGKAKNNVGPEAIRRHNKGCNCKRSGCLKNYCECYEAKIACSANCKCVGCRNIEDSMDRSRRDTPGDTHTTLPTSPTADTRHTTSHQKQPCRFMTSQVIDAVCACLLEAAREGSSAQLQTEVRDPVHSVLEEFARCLQDIITASCQAHIST